MHVAHHLAVEVEQKVLFALEIARGLRQRIEFAHQALAQPARSRGAKARERSTDSALRQGWQDRTARSRPRCLRNACPPDPCSYGEILVGRKSHLVFERQTVERVADVVVQDVERRVRTSSPASLKSHGSSSARPANVSRNSCHVPRYPKRSSALPGITRRRILRSGRAGSCSFAEEGCFGLRRDETSASAFFLARRPARPRRPSRRLASCTAAFAAVDEPRFHRSTHGGFRRLAVRRSRVGIAAEFWRHRPRGRLAPLLRRLCRRCAAGLSLLGGSGLLGGRLFSRKRRFAGGIALRTIGPSFEFGTCIGRRRAIAGRYGAVFFASLDSRVFRYVFSPRYQL